MDARLDTHRLLGLAEGDAHVIRNAGGVVSDDVVRSLVVSQRLLGTREIQLVHHTDCGMLKFRDDAVKDAIEADTGLRPPFAASYAIAPPGASTRDFRRDLEEEPRGAAIASCGDWG